MEFPHEPDPRTDDELFGEALRGDDPDDEVAWAAIRELHARGTESIFQRAVGLLRSAAAWERMRGADLLAQLGVPHPTVGLPKRCGDALLAALAQETAPHVAASIAVALGHLHDPRAAAALAPFAKHPDPEVRLAVAHGLLGQADRLAVATMIELSADPDQDVRNWATFGLGDMLEGLDTPEIRDALAARLGEADSEVRGEALLGLASRQDPRVREPLQLELARGNPTVVAVEAAGTLGDPANLPALRELRARATPGYFRNVVLEVIAHLEAVEGP